MRFGRLPRAYNPAIPHFSALKMSVPVVAAPASWDNTKALPSTLGMFGNNSVGDCTLAGLYAAKEVWTANAQGRCDIQPDANALKAYSEACGYVPGQPNTDQGGIEQEVLTYAMLRGVPTGRDGSGRHQIAAFCEVDPTNIADIKVAIYTAGLVYIGFAVPSYMPMQAGSTWDVQPGQPKIVGGHCVICAGYDANGLKVVSWGGLYTMTWGFWAATVDEAYLLADADYIAVTGKTPGGLALTDLEAQMWAIREPAQQAA